MSQGNSGKIIAEGSVNGADGAKLSGMGFASARTGAGVYTITLDQPVDATQSEMQVTPQVLGAARIANFVHTSDGVKGVETFTNVPAAIDVTFAFIIRQCNQ